MQTVIGTVPFHNRDLSSFFSAGTEYFRGLWPARWVRHAAAGEKPFVHAYRLAFSLDRKERVRLRRALAASRASSRDDRGSGAPEVWNPITMKSLGVSQGY